jgi:leucyl-tRNA synthetase
VRLCRRRFWKGEYATDKIAAYQTLYTCLDVVAKLSAPIAPFFMDRLYLDLNVATQKETFDSVHLADFPVFDASHLVESSKTYPVSFNGKMRFTLELSLDLTKDQIEETVMAHEKTIAQLDGATPKKVIIVPGKIINIVG